VTAAAAAAVAIACDDELGARESKKDGVEDGFEGVAMPRRLISGSVRWGKRKPLDWVAWVLAMLEMSAGVLLLLGVRYWWESVGTGELVTYRYPTV
jgi:hypothetical protein